MRTDGQQDICLELPLATHDGSNTPLTCAWAYAKKALPPLTLNVSIVCKKSSEKASGGFLSATGFFFRARLLRGVCSRRNQHLVPNWN